MPFVCYYGISYSVFDEIMIVLMMWLYLPNGAWPHYVDDGSDGGHVHQCASFANVARSAMARPTVDYSRAACGLQLADSRF